MKILKIIRFPRIMSIEKQAKIWFKPKFRCIFDKSEISTVSCKRCYEITPCRCQEGSHLTGLFRIDSKGWKRLSNFISTLLAIEEKKKHENAFVLSTLRANTLFTKERSKPACQTHYFQMSQTSLQVFDINVKLNSLAKEARRLKLEDRM